VSHRACDVVIVGAGAAGLATAVFAAREAPGASIALLDGARTLGAKILVSGGGRCNVTNRRVSEADFNGAPSHVVRRVLRALPVPATVGFFRALGVHLHEEARGKLFPDTNRARTVLDALVGACREAGVRIVPSSRVTAVSRVPAGFVVETPAGPVASRSVVLATGGLALPRTGSDGLGYRFATALGHALVPTTPALAPLLLSGSWHRALAGVSPVAELVLGAGGSRTRRVTGPLLWTHFGVSGPAALDMSRHWLRATLEGRAATLTAGAVPGAAFADVERWLVDLAARHPRARAAHALRNAPLDVGPASRRGGGTEDDGATRLPAALAEAIVARVCGAPDPALADLRRDERRACVHALTALALEVAGSRGYDHAEATAGGVDLTSVQATTLHSRSCPGLFFAGEVLDVDGRLGGFNFQWAWASARAAATGVAGYLRDTA
jgi:predicted Rossmann fold flavoprotein